MSVDQDNAVFQQRKRLSSIGARIGGAVYVGEMNFLFVCGPTPTNLSVTTFDLNAMCLSSFECGFSRNAVCFSSF